MSSLSTEVTECNHTLNGVAIHCYYNHHDLTDCHGDEALFQTNGKIMNVTSIDDEMEEEVFYEKISCEPSMRRVLRRCNQRGKENDEKRKKHKDSKKVKRAKLKKYENIVVVSEDQIISSCDTYTDDKTNMLNIRVNEKRSQSVPRPLHSSPTTNYKMHGILPAAELGIEDEAMYERLLSIIEGDDILPEDYDLLLQLDNKNARKTLERNVIDEFPTMVIGESSLEDDKDQFCKSSRCEICLESWAEGYEVRRLPCGHLFCKGCIDNWLTKRSDKCPNLSCFWSLEMDKN